MVMKDNMPARGKSFHDSGAAGGRKGGTAAREGGNGAGEGIRTLDLRFTKPLLCH